MLIEIYNEKIANYYEETGHSIPSSTQKIISSFLRKKSLESTENTITFQEIMNYLRLNQLILKPEIRQENKTDDELLIELLKSTVDISDENKIYVDKHYKWKKLMTGVHPQLNYPNHTILDLAAFFGDVTSVKNSINEGNDVNISMGYGSTPLMSACLCKDHKSAYQCIKLLLQAGANCNVENQFKHTALEYAVKEGNKAAVELLLAYGAKVDATILAIAEKKSSWRKLGTAKHIFDLLKQANNSIIENRHAFMTKIIDEATPKNFCTEVSDLIASFDSRSYEARYFKQVNDKKAPLFPDSQFLDMSQQQP